MNSSEIILTIEKRLQRYFFRRGLKGGREGEENARKEEYYKGIIRGLEIAKKIIKEGSNGEKGKAND